MINLLQYLFTQLKEVHPRVYLEEAPEIDPATKEKPIFPYVVYSLPNSSDNDSREDFILQIETWDETTNTINLENLTNSIDVKLNRTQYMGSNFFVRFERVNRMMIPDPNPKIKRRELRFLCKVYFF